MNGKAGTLLYMNRSIYFIDNSVDGYVYRDCFPFGKESFVDADENQLIEAEVILFTRFAGSQWFVCSHSCNGVQDGTVE